MQIIIRIIRIVNLKTSLKCSYKKPGKCCGPNKENDQPIHQSSSSPSQKRYCFMNNTGEDPIFFGLSDEGGDITSSYKDNTIVVEVLFVVSLHILSSYSDLLKDRNLRFSRLVMHGSAYFVGSDSDRGRRRDAIAIYDHSPCYNHIYVLLLISMFSIF